MAKLGNLYISLIADTAAFSSGLNKAKSDLNSASALMNAGLAKIDKAFTGLGHSMKDIGREIFSVKGAFTALIGSIGIGSIVELGKQAVEAVGHLGEVADQIGVTTDTLQAFRYAATQVGVSQEEMDNGLQKLTKTIGLAATGNKTAIDSFNQFGIKILDASGKVRPTDDVIRDIADAIQKLPDPAQRAAAAVDFFGKAGQRIIPFLQDGAKGVDEFVQKAKGLGLVFDKETITRADDAADKLATLALVLKTDFQAALVELAPILSAVAGKLIEFSGAVNQLFQDAAPDDAKGLDALERKFDKISDLADETQANLDKLAADKSSASSLTKWLDSILPGASIDDQIAAAKSTLADYLATLEKLHLLIDQKQLAAGSAPAAPVVGVSNPTPKPTGGKSQAQKDEEEAEKMIIDLQRQIDNFAADPLSTKVDDALAKISAASDETKTKVAALIGQVKTLTITDEEYARVVAADAEAVQQFDAEMKQGKQTLESLRTPIEIYRDRLAELQELHREGAIGSATFARGIDAAKASLDAAQSQASNFNSAMTELGSTWTSAFEEAALSMDDAGFSAKSLGDTMKGLLQDIERIILRLSVEDPIAKGLGGINWGQLLFGGTNAAGFRTTGAGPGASGNTNASGGGWLSGLLSIFGFHGGGIAGGRSTFTRGMPALAFAGAPRLHTGGFIGPGEVPAILQRGEGVFTREQMANMAPAGGGDLNIQIVNNTGVDADAKASTGAGADGQKQLLITLEKKLAGSVRAGGPLGKAISDTMGTSRVAQVQRG
jgi:hypothetical protein